MFKNLDQEKKKKILDAAFAEFAEYGYKNASTNRIVKAAGIGKGMLFYYFENKKTLYLDLIEYGLKYITDVYISRLGPAETDFIEKYKSAGKIKMEAMLKDPDLFNFFGSTYLNQDKHEFPAEVGEKLAELRDASFSIIFSKIDKTLFRADIPADTSIRFIQWTIVGYEQELIAKLRREKLTSLDINPYWDEFYAFLDTLKTIYYAQEA